MSIENAWIHAVVFSFRAEFRGGQATEAIYFHRSRHHSRWINIDMCHLYGSELLACTMTCLRIDVQRVAHRTHVAAWNWREKVSLSRVSHTVTHGTGEVIQGKSRMILWSRVLPLETYHSHLSSERRASCENLFCISPASFSFSLILNTSVSYWQCSYGGVMNIAGVFRWGCIQISTDVVIVSGRYLRGRS